MITFEYRRLREQAKRSLTLANVSPRKLVMLHSGVTIGLGLVLSVLSYLLGLGIDQTGGLSGIGTRSILETAQSVLQMVNLILLPFWSLGYIRAALQWKAGQPVDSNTLFFGLKCWGPALRKMLLQGVVYFALMMAGAQLAGLLYMLTPAAKGLYAVVEEMTAQGITDPYEMMQSQAYVAAAMKAAPFVGAGMLLFLLPVAWRLRFADYALMEAPEQGALRAMLRSLGLTRKRFLPLLKLDLRFWWFYLAEGLILVLGYGDLLLEFAGVELGLHGDAAMFVFYIAALICEFGLYVWKKNEVFVTYALAYEQLAQPREVPRKPKPQNVPWNYEQ